MAHYRCKQSGLTLVELMIAMLIGLFLLQGVLYVFQSSKSGFRLIEAEAAMHDSALFAIESLNSTIRLAGYNEDHTLTYADIDTDGNAVVDGDVIQGSDGGVGTPDTIVVFFTGDADGIIEDCLGTTVATGDVAVNTFQIDTVDNELECTADPGTGVATTQPLISNITDMQVNWGIDSNADGEADQFVGYPGTVAARNQIVALIITLTLSSGAGDSAITNKTFTTAVALRNKL